MLPRVDESHSGTTERVYIVVFNEWVELWYDTEAW